MWETWGEIHGWDDRLKKTVFPLFLKGTALEWFHFCVLTEEKATYKSLKVAFAARFLKPPVSKWKKLDDFMRCTEQFQGEPVDEYAQRVRCLGNALNQSEMTIFDVTVKGLRPRIKDFVLDHDLEINTVDEVLKRARHFQATRGEDADTVDSAVTELKEQVSRLTNVLTMQAPKD